jgi:hypothetical protein
VLLAFALGACAQAPVVPRAVPSSPPAKPASQSQSPRATARPAPKPAPLVLRSVFHEGQRLPNRYTCEGEEMSPPLFFSGVPERARELVVFLEDPDAPGRTFVHWVVFGISPRTTRVEEGSIPDGARQAVNDFGTAGYGGPCPPPGPAHRYRFTLYALSSVLALQDGAPSGDVRTAIARRLLASDTLTATYRAA